MPDMESDRVIREREKKEGGGGGGREQASERASATERDREMVKPNPTPGFTFFNPTSD
jgi:hypothetical protein